MLATVAANGKVEKVVAESGNGLLVGAAQDAVMEWRFAPADAETKEQIHVDFNPAK